MKFYYMTRVNDSNRKLEYFEGMVFHKNKMKANWSAHWMGSGNMTIAFSSDMNGFAEVIETYQEQFTDHTIRSIELDE